MGLPEVGGGDVLLFTGEREVLGGVVDMMAGGWCCRRGGDVRVMFEGKDFLISSFEKGLRVPAISWVFKVLVKCGILLFRKESRLNRKGVWRFKFFGGIFAVAGYFVVRPLIVLSFGLKGFVCELW